MKTEKQPLTDDDIAVLERVALTKLDQDDNAQATRWALALAGDMPFDPPATPEQAARLKKLVISCLDSGSWRMRRLAVGLCWNGKWLKEPAVRSKIETIAKSDPAAAAKLAASRALEQFDKTELYKNNVGPP